MSQATAEFGKWRSFFWPIHNFELKKFLPMFFMFLLISFNYTILRDTKDTLIVTASGSGAETIPFLKLWGVLPFAVLFMLIYAKLSNKLSKSALFYASVVPFLAFFVLFDLVLYPARDFLHPTTFADKLQAILPVGFKGLIAIFRNWTYSLFYIFAELWGSVGISLLFWGFANDIIKSNEAKRVYAVMGIGANLALLLSGGFIFGSAKIRTIVPPTMDAWWVTLHLLTIAIVLAGVGILYLYSWMQKNVLTDPRFYNPDEQKAAKKAKPKLSMKESFLYLIRSKYLGLLALLVIGYGMSINLVEVTWKGQLKLQYPNANDYQAFMGMFSATTGTITVLMMLFVGGNVIRRFGWGVGALFTPVVLFVTGAIFFTFIIFKSSLLGLVAMLGTTPLFLAVMVGAVQNILSKATKYSLFDPTKEMVYIPLDQETKVKGKAAIDVVGARLGKSGGSLLQQLLFVGLAVTDIGAIAPILAVLILGTITVWIIAAYALNKEIIKRETAKAAPASPQEKKVLQETAVS